MMADCEACEGGNVNVQTGEGGDQVLHVTSVCLRKVSGTNVSKIVDLFESKTESKDNGLLKLMSGRKKTPGKKLQSILTPVKKH